MEMRDVESGQNSQKALDTLDERPDYQSSSSAAAASYEVSAFGSEEDSLSQGRLHLHFEWLNARQHKVMH